MNSLLQRIITKVGIDKSIAYSSGARIITGVAGVVTVFFISIFLTGVEQGFYFTFGSLLAMQVFFELGLTGIMTQYVAHEVSHLELISNQYEEEFKYKSRLASLVRFCFKWYLILAIIVFLFLLIVGYFYFNKYGNNNEEVSWKMPWIIICLGTAIKLFQSPFSSILTGLGKVKEMSKISFYQQLIIPLATWLGLVVGLKLYVVGLGYLLSVIIWQIYVWNTELSKIVLNLWKVKIVERVDYIKEIFPYQWKIALSWISGYFIFQLFNPVLFASDGPVIAGQMGMTMTVLSSISALSLSWMNTKIPLYCSLIALKKYEELDNKFFQTLKQMIFVGVGMLLLLLLFLLLLDITHISFKNSLLKERFLGLIPTALLMVTVILQLITSSFATYLRCHKKEPFLINSICVGIMCMTSTIVLGKMYGLYGVVLGYVCIQLATFPWGCYIFKTKRALWHQINQNY